MGIIDHEGPTLQAPPRRCGLAGCTRKCLSSQNSAKQGLTAVSLVAHVSAVIVKITPPDAVDTLPVVAPILVAETGVLWPWREAEEKMKPTSFFLLNRKTFCSEFPFIFLK